MNYLSLDLETTGLDPLKHKIVEFGAVFDNGKPIDELPTFRRIIFQEDAIWSIYCLNLHKHWYYDAVIQKPEHPELSKPGSLMREFLDWYYGQSDQKIMLAGKNVGAFDLQFIKQLPDYNPRDFRHRTLDPTMYYILPEDKVPPDLKTCMLRAGLPYDEKLAHTALYDAKCVVQLLRARMPQKVHGDE